MRRLGSKRNAGFQGHGATRGHGRPAPLKLHRQGRGLQRGPSIDVERGWDHRGRRGLWSSRRSRVWFRGRASGAGRARRALSLRGSRTLSPGRRSLIGPWVPRSGSRLVTRFKGRRLRGGAHGRPRGRVVWRGRRESHAGWGRPRRRGGRKVVLLRRRRGSPPEGRGAHGRSAQASAGVWVRNESPGQGRMLQAEGHNSVACHGGLVVVWEEHRL